MKVALASSKYPPEYAGSGLRAHRTYQRLCERFDIDIEVLTSSTEYARPATYDHEGFRVRRIVNPLVRKLPGNRRPARALRHQVEASSTRKALDEYNPDIVHVFGQSPVTTETVMWSRRNKVPLMLELVNTRDSPYLYPPGLGWATDYDLRRQCVLVAISQALGDVCRDHGLVENVWVRPNPVDESKFRYTTDRTPEPVGELTAFTQDDRILLYVGKFRPSKNHRFLVEVLNELPEEYKLVVGGPVVSAGPNRERDRRLVVELRELIRRRDLADRVDVRAEFVDMARHLYAADVFLHPSTEEGLGTPVLESLCCGVPVIANRDVRSFHEMVDQGENGYLVPLEPAAWADAIQSAAGFDQDQRRKISEACREQASSRTIDQGYARLLEALSKAEPNEVINVNHILSEGKPIRDGESYAESG